MNGGKRSKSQAVSIATRFEQAMTAWRAGRPAEASRIAREIASAAPNFGGAHYLMGLVDLEAGDAASASAHLACALEISPDEPALHFAMGQAREQTGSPHAAIVHYRKALTKAPDHALANLRLAHLLHGIGKGDEALTLAERAVAVNPADSDARHFLAGLLLEGGKTALAADHLRRVLQARPDWPAALNNFGLALTRLGRFEEAAIILAGAVDLCPQHGSFGANLAACLRDLGRIDEARARAEAAVRADPACCDAWMELGLARRAQGHPEGAKAAFERAVALSPDRIPAHWCLAETCRDLGQTERAIQHYRHCLELDPDDRHGAGLGLALAGGGALPAQAPAAYVRQLFDDYAERFDTALVQALDYRAPALLDKAVRAVVGEDAAGLDVLDIGCGTGLMAPLVRPMARHLTGIDLSPAMLERARARDLYDELGEADLVDALNARRAAVDLVVAADVLVYVGDLEPALAGAWRALRPGGVFAFSVERAEDGGAGFQLGLKSRYAHAPAYVRARAEQAGFVIRILEDAVLRRENGRDVAGLITVLVKPENPS